MKKYMSLILMFVITSCFFSVEKVEATPNDVTTDVAITFLQEEDLIELPPTSQPPLPNGGASSAISHGKLPSTGDLITPIIWTLIGLSLLIVWVGVYSLKNVFKAQSSL